MKDEPKWTVKLSSRLVSDTCDTATDDDDADESLDLNGLDNFTDKAFSASLHSKQWTSSFFSTHFSGVTHY